MIAIKKDDPNYWLHLTSNFPVNEEDVKKFYLFDLEAEDLPHAVRIAKIKRGVLEARSNYDLTVEGGD